MRILTCNNLLVFANYVLCIRKKWTGLFTFVLEYIMSIIGDTTKDGVCVSGVPSVNFLGLDIKPVLIIHKIIPENVIKNDKKQSYILVLHRKL